MSIPTNFLTATETQALLDTGKTTPVQIIKDHQARYNDRNDQVQAWVTTNFEGALAAAAKDDKTKGLPLHVVVGVKDIISMYGAR
jgi:Asp-tRNA(Asn)/Glu-tRNA(Gln) amidotransferase A subunit family amidase